MDSISEADQWVQKWWFRAAAIVANYDDEQPEDPWAWDEWLAFGRRQRRTAQSPRTMNCGNSVPLRG